MLPGRWGEQLKRFARVSQSQHHVHDLHSRSLSRFRLSVRQEHQAYFKIIAVTHSLLPRAVFFSEIRGPSTLAFNVLPRFLTWIFIAIAQHIRTKQK